MKVVLSKLQFFDDEEEWKECTPALPASRQEVVGEPGLCSKIERSDTCELHSVDMFHLFRPGCYNIFILPCD